MMIKRDNDFMLFGASSTQHVFKGLMLFLSVYIGASLFASILTPPIFWAVEWLNANCHNDLWAYLDKKKVDVYYDRLRWLPIIISLPFIFKSCGLFSLKTLGVGFDKYSRSVFLKFFLLGGFATLFLVALQAIFLGMGIRENANFASACFTSLLGGLILGFLEEIVFRGLIMRCVYSAFGVVSAIVLSSLFFAYKHFKVPSSVVRNMLLNGGHSAEWDTGFLVCYHDAIGILSSFEIVQFLSLFFLAAILCVFYLKTKSLNSAIAFHSATVFVMLFSNKCFYLKDVSKFHLFGAGAITNGIACLVVMLLVFAFAVFVMKTSKRSMN